MKFIILSNYLQKLEETSSRIEITKILADLYKRSDANEIDKISYLLLGRLAPKYEGKVFNLAERMMMTTLSEAFGKDLNEVKKMYKDYGDLGIVAEKLTDKNDSGVTTKEVFDELLNISEIGGEGSQEIKIKKLASLLKTLDSLSLKFVVRIPIGKLRLGFSDKTILDSLSWMESGDKSSKAKLEKAYQVLPDIGLLAKNVKKVGIDKASKNIIPKVGVPIQAMLAQRLKSPKEMIKKMKEVAIEPKLDGLRIQIHFKRGKFVKAFTRNLNETSWMFPELKELGKFIKGDEVILDSEAVGVDETRKILADFQTTMTRRRKHDIEDLAKKIPIRFYIFDIMYKDADPVMRETYTVRRKILVETLRNGPGFEVVESSLTSNADEIAKFNLDYRGKGLEGIIIKKIDSEYVPGRTGWRWVKMKESEDAAGKLSDTIDCVVMGFSTGKGKRVGFGIGQFLVGIVEGDKFKTLTKVGTGLTDDQFKALDEKLKSIISKDMPKEYEVQKDYFPDYWVEPSVVVELAGDDLTVSPKHTSGYALRFPRLVKFREDKNPSDATSISEVEKLFQIQKK